MSQCGCPSTRPRCRSGLLGILRLGHRKDDSAAKPTQQRSTERGREAAESKYCPAWIRTVAHFVRSRREKPQVSLFALRLRRSSTPFLQANGRFGETSQFSPNPFRWFSSRRLVAAESQSCPAWIRTRTPRSRVSWPTVSRQGSGIKERLRHTVAVAKRVSSETVALSVLR